MKKLVFFTCLLVSAFQLTTVHADDYGSSKNPCRKVKGVQVCNEPENPVPVMIDEATVTVANELSNPVPVQMTKGDDCGKEITSAFVEGPRETVLTRLPVK